VLASYNARNVVIILPKCSLIHFLYNAMLVLKKKKAKNVDAGRTWISKLQLISCLDVP
jgi:hypothetical protein